MASDLHHIFKRASISKKHIQSEVIQLVMLSRFCHLLSNTTSDCLNSASFKHHHTFCPYLLAIIIDPVIFLFVFINFVDLHIMLLVFINVNYHIINLSSFVCSQGTLLFCNCLSYKMCHCDKFSEFCICESLDFLDGSLL